MRGHTVIGLGLAVCLGAAALPAQSALPDSVRAAITAAARIRVRTAQRWGALRDPRLEGDNLMWDSGTLYSRRSGRPETGIRALAVTDLTRVDVWRGTHAGRGALIGAAVGAGMGLVLGVALANDEFFQLSAGGVAAMSAGFGLAGGLLGALVGSMVPRWEPVYRTQ